MLTDEGHRIIEIIESLEGEVVLEPWDSLDKLPTMVELYKVEHALDDLMLRMSKCHDFRALEAIDVKYSNLTDAGVAPLVVFNKLTHLILDGTQITDIATESISRLKNLILVRVSFTKIGNTGVARLATLPQLEGLYLGRTEVTDACAEAIAEVPSLSGLYLDQCNITDLFPARLVNCKHLEVFSCCSTAVTKSGVAELAARGVAVNM